MRNIIILSIVSVIFIASCDNGPSDEEKLAAYEAGREEREKRREAEKKRLEVMGFTGKEFRIESDSNAIYYLVSNESISTDIQRIVTGRISNSPNAVEMGTKYGFSIRAICFYSEA